ncbi:MATE family efflux transporter [Photobacterium leiognathi]|uniref:MATE family efflux transporter n=1 Tax=Photobacterium leiognathi TaxID=553611 RepID=UPI001EE1003C|nr:MATE family efflux transporter [Photobacterium leiognathi]MCG3884412.1 MATE family efflux transporter [Photobacterium leiognathi]
MKNYIKVSFQILKLAVPVLIAAVAQTAMGFIDTVMAGGVSATDMAAVAVASSIWLPTILFGVGLLMAIVPVVARLNGSGKGDKIPEEVKAGFAIAAILSIPMMFILYKSGLIINYMNTEDVLAAKTIGYLHAVLFAVPALLLFQTLKSFSEGLSYTIPGMIIGFMGLLLNIPLNWIFVYGKMGIMPLGGVGCGVATAIVYWFMFFAMLFYTQYNKKLNTYKILKFDTFPKLKMVTELVRLGLPIALSMFFEVSLFAIIALLIAPLGSTIVAAHQIAMNYSTLIYMLPMSIGAAASIKISHAIGRGSIEKAKIVSMCGLLIGVTIAICTAILTVIFKEEISLLYTDNKEVVIIAGQLLLLSAIYQVSDAVQVVASGALRGYKDMRAIFICTFIAYWIVGLPVGYVLGATSFIHQPMGASGYWIGFILGLTCAAAMLGIRMLMVHNDLKRKKQKLLNDKI